MSSRGVRVDWHLETVDNVWEPLDCEEHTQSVYVRRKVVLEAWMALWRVRYRPPLVRGSCVAAWLYHHRYCSKAQQLRKLLLLLLSAKRQVSPCCWIVYSRSTCLFPTVWIIMVGEGGGAFTMLLTWRLKSSGTCRYVWISLDWRVVKHNCVN